MPCAVIHLKTKQRGFSLVELAVVVTVIALLMGGLAMGMSAQIDLQRTNESRATLERVRDALIGFAAANGRLPCPASPTSDGHESFCTNGDPFAVCGPHIMHPTAPPRHGRCAHLFDGFVPAATLGITPAGKWTDPGGTKRCCFVLDAWNNPVHYAVPNYNVPDPDDATKKLYVFTGIGEGGKGGMKAVGMPAIETYASNSGLLSVWSWSNVGSLPCRGVATRLTQKTPSIIYSLGKNGSIPPTGTQGEDETRNPNPFSTDNDSNFVSHEIAPPEACGGEFDDIVTWLSLPVLFNRMIVAGRLP